MKNKILLIAGIILFSLPPVMAQSEDPEKVLEKSDDKEKLDEWLKERKWKRRKPGTNEAGEEYYLYRKKSFGGGFVYIAVYPKRFVHYQNFHDEKHDYSPVMTYDDFIQCPEGKTHDGLSLENEEALIKNIQLVDPHNALNKNNFYGVIPKSHFKEKE